jgi:hypothetical protein
MDSEAEVNRLHHERNVWRGLAIGLAAALVLLISLGGIGVLLLTKRTAMRAEEEARARVFQERVRAEAVRQAAEKQKAK